MAIPDFVLALRAKIGHDPLWLSGVTAVVVRPSSDASSSSDGSSDGSSNVEVLLVRRADTGAWTPVTGIIDPGEEPASSSVSRAAASPSPSGWRTCTPCRR